MTGKMPATAHFFPAFQQCALQIDRLPAAAGRGAQRQAREANNHRYVTTGSRKALCSSQATDEHWLVVPRDACLPSDDNDK
jgi:hypothetical protein